MLRYPPQPEDREMAEEYDAADPLLEEEESETEGDGGKSIPLAETGDEEEDDDEDEEPLERRVSRKRRGTQFDEDASSRVPALDAEPSSVQPLVVSPLRAAPPVTKKKKYAPAWALPRRGGVNK